MLVGPYVPLSARSPGVPCEHLLHCAIWVGMALSRRSSASDRGLGALVEILVGAVFGNIPGLKEQVHQTDNTTFLAASAL